MQDEWKSCITTKQTKTEASVSPVVPTAVNNNNYTEEKKSALKIGNIIHLQFAVFLY